MVEEYTQYHLIMGNGRVDDLLVLGEEPLDMFFKRGIISMGKCSERPGAGHGGGSPHP